MRLSANNLEEERRRSAAVRRFRYHLMTHVLGEGRIRRDETRGPDAPRWAIAAIVGLMLSVMHPAIAQEGSEAPAGTAGDAVPGVSRTEIRELVDEKMVFLNGLKQEWFAEGEEAGIYDPRSREGMELRTSYSDE